MLKLFKPVLSTIATGLKNHQEVIRIDPLLVMIILGVIGMLFFGTFGIDFPIIWILYLPYVFLILHLLKLAKPIYG